MKLKFKKQGRYKCACGKRFYRTEAKECMIIRSHAAHKHECVTAILERLNNNNKCPVCDATVIPYSIVDRF